MRRDPYLHPVVASRRNEIDADVWKGAIDSNAPASGERIYQLRQGLQPVRIDLIGADELGRETQHETRRRVRFAARAIVTRRTATVAIL